MRQFCSALLVASLAVLSVRASAHVGAAASPEAAFWAVAGSFVNHAAARAAAQQLTQRTGASATILTATTAAGRTHRVALGPWPSTAEALEAVRRLHDAGYADAWKFAGDGDAAPNVGQDAQRTVGPTARQDAPPAAEAAPAPQTSKEPDRSGNSRVRAQRPATVARAGADRASPIAYHADLRASTAFGTTGDSPAKQKEELSLIAGIRASFEAPKALGLSAFQVTTRIRREGSDALVPGKPGSRSAVRHHFDAYAEAELRQAWAELRRDDWRFRIGRQTVVWGETRGLDVLDIVNPKSYREFLLDGSSVPLWMLNAERQVGQGTLQALLVLERQGHQLPRTGGVFAPELYADRPKLLARSRYRDVEPGLRYSFARDGWALTLNALRHRDDWPVWRLDETGARRAFEPRMSTLGASAAKTYGGYDLRVEATVSDRRHFHGSVNDIYASPEFASVVGIGWTALAGTRIDVQFSQFSALDHTPRMARDETEMTAIVHAERTLPGTGLAASLAMHQGLSGQGALIRSRVTWQARENLAIAAFADLFDGRPGAFYGQFARRDRIGLTVHLAY